MAATGFGLSALCIAHERGYLKKDDAEQRVERTLDFFARRAFSQRGFYFHFLIVYPDSAPLTANSRPLTQPGFYVEPYMRESISVRAPSGV